MFPLSNAVVLVVLVVGAMVLADVVLVSSEVAYYDRSICRE